MYRNKNGTIYYRFRLTNVSSLFFNISALIVPKYEFSIATAKNIIIVDGYTFTSSGIAVDGVIQWRCVADR